MACPPRTVNLVAGRNPTPYPMPPDPALPDAARALLDRWFGDGLTVGWPTVNRHDLWFDSTAAQDDDLRERFGPWVDQALAGGLTDWSRDPLARLALVLLLDQLPRNLYRRQARAFAGDPRAQQLAVDAVARNMDAALPVIGRVFLYMPFMHAEDLALQQQGVALFERLPAEGPTERRDALANHLRYAVLHRDIVARFGRFPHRNAVLGRTDTEEEARFLIDGPRFGQ